VPELAVISFERADAGTAATGMSQRFASDIMRKHFPVPALAVTLPGTTVTARTSSSGEFSQHQGHGIVRAGIGVDDDFFAARTRGGLVQSAGMRGEL